MRLQRLEATAFLAQVASGRNHPVLLHCEGLDGAATGDFVVKLRDGFENGPAGFAFEVLAALLARRLGLDCPAPAAIVVDKALAEATAEVNSTVGNRMRRSIGLNFGSTLPPGPTHLGCQGVYSFKAAPSRGRSFRL
jgi:hypothetical protein